MTVGIVSDGGVSLGTLKPSVEVHLVPMRLFLDGNEFVDEEELTPEVLAGMSTMTTSAPSPGEFLEAIEDADEGDGVLVLTVGAALSSSFESAEMAAGLRTSTSSRVRVLDSTSATSGQGLVVLAAAEAAAAGNDLDEVYSAAAGVTARVRLVAEIVALDQLVRGGRVPASAATVGRLVGVRPVFELHGSKIRPLRPALSAAGAESRILAALRRSTVPEATLEVLGLFGNESATAERLVEQAIASAPVSLSGVARLSPVMVAHTGVDVDGLAWWWRPAT